MTALGDKTRSASAATTDVVALSSVVGTTSQAHQATDFLCDVWTHINARFTPNRIVNPRSEALLVLKSSLRLESNYFEMSGRRE